MLNNGKKIAEIFHINIFTKFIFFCLNYTTRKTCPSKSVSVHLFPIYYIIKVYLILILLFKPYLEPSTTTSPITTVKQSSYQSSETSSSSSSTSIIYTSVTTNIASTKKLTTPITTTIPITRKSNLFFSKIINSNKLI